MTERRISILIADMDVCSYAAKIALTERLDDARKNSGLVARDPIRPPYIGTMGEVGFFTISTRIGKN